MNPEDLKNAEGMIISPEELPERYAVACHMICVMTRILEGDNPEIEGLTPVGVNDSIASMIANGDSPLSVETHHITKEDLENSGAMR